nr:hypothetical protein Iba_chr02aCG1270 [Ipomoea batatas]
MHSIATKATNGNTSLYNVVEYRPSPPPTTAAFAAISLTSGACLSSSIQQSSSSSGQWGIHQGRIIKNLHDPKGVMHIVELLLSYCDPELPLTNLSVPIFQISESLLTTIEPLVKIVVASYELDSFTSPSIWYQILLLCTYSVLLRYLDARALDSLDSLEAFAIIKTKSGALIVVHEVGETPISNVYGGIRRGSHKRSLNYCVSVSGNSRGFIDLLVYRGFSGLDMYPCSGHIVSQPTLKHIEGFSSMCQNLSSFP